MIIPSSVYYHIWNNHRVTVCLLFASAVIVDREWGVWKGIIHSGLRGLLARGKWGSKECIIVRKFNAAHIKYNNQKKMRSKYTGN